MGNKKRKTRTKRGAGPDPNLTDWKSGKPMTYCQDRERAKYRLCNNVCGSKAKGVQNKKGVPSKKKMEQCELGHSVQKGNVVLPVNTTPLPAQVKANKNFAYCNPSLKCESMATKAKADALVKGIKDCDLKGVDMYKKCQAVCPDKAGVADDSCHLEHPAECGFRKTDIWKKQRRELPCPEGKWEPQGAMYAKRQMTAEKDCAAQSWLKKDGGETDEPFVKDKNQLKYASDSELKCKKYKGCKDVMIPGSFGKCQARRRSENVQRLEGFCKGSIIKKGTFKKTYGVKCEVDKEVAYKKSPKECLQCGGRHSKHKRTYKKRRRKKKTKRRRTKRKRVKRRRRTRKR